MEQLDYLKSVYEKSDLWVNKGMALKAIGDIGNADAKAYLQKSLSEFENGTSKKARWNTEII